MLMAMQVRNLGISGGGYDRLPEAHCCILGGKGSKGWH